MMRGRCLCGQVEFEVDPLLRPVIACHCGQCRKTSGHYWAASSVPHAQFHLIRDEGLRWYQSSATARRGFCGGCGASLFWQPEGEARISFAPGALEGETGLGVESHWFTEDAGDYYTPDIATVAAEPLHGGCLCGGVSYESGPATGEVVACHCSMCRKTSGHFWAAVPVAKAALYLTGDRSLRWYRSSPGAERGFCGDCGASVFWRMDGSEQVYLGAGTLAAPTGLRLARHIYVADKGDYYSLDDGLPQSAAWE